MKRGEKAPSEAEVIELTRCPDCGQAKGSGCVYMPVAFPSSPNADKVGLPTKVVHRGRRIVARQVRARRERERAARPLPRELPVRARIAQAEDAWERRERVQLVQWLAQHAHILLLD